MSEMMTTTFRYPREDHWQFKNVVNQRKARMGTICSNFINHYIEDHQDEVQMEKILERLKSTNKKNYLEWEEFKRRMNLDV